MKFGAITKSHPHNETVSLDNSPAGGAAWPALKKINKLREERKDKENIRGDIRHHTSIKINH
jgi:hypothetical protein